jgi:hypothetical protein
LSLWLSVTPILRPAHGSPAPGPLRIRTRPTLSRSAESAHLHSPWRQVMIRYRLECFFSMTLLPGVAAHARTRQRLTLVHFSAQLEPCLTHSKHFTHPKHPLTTP